MCIVTWWDEGRMERGSTPAPDVVDAIHRLGAGL
jgi:hypothetical protein